MQPTVSQYRFDFGFVPLPELHDRASCESGKHGDHMPASTETALGSRGGFIEAMRPYGRGVGGSWRVVLSSAHVGVRCWREAMTIVVSWRNFGFCLGCASSKYHLTSCHRKRLHLSAIFHLCIYSFVHLKWIVVCVTVFASHGSNTILCVLASVWPYNRTYRPSEINSSSSLILSLYIQVL